MYALEATPARIVCGMLSHQNKRSHATRTLRHFVACVAVPSRARDAQLGVCTGTRRRKRIDIVYFPDSLNI